MKAFTLLAFIAVWAVVFAAQILDGGDPKSLFTHPGPLLLVFGGAVLAAAMGSTFADMKQALAGLKISFLGNKIPAVPDTIERLRSLAEVRATGGIMALETKAKEYADDAFLARGVSLILDGVEPDELRALLEADITAMEDRHKIGSKFYEMAGGYAPTIGIVGTVMGLVHVLESLDQPDKLGPAIGAAFLATLWGVASANLIWLPINYKLKRLSAEEVALRELVTEGLVAVHTSATPRATVERLQSLLSVKQRNKLGAR